MHKHKHPLVHRSVKHRVLAEAKNFRLHSADNRRYVESFYRGLGSPIALSCCIQYTASANVDLVNRDIDPAMYLDVDFIPSLYCNRTRFHDDFSAISFLRKHRSLETGIDKKKVALDAFTLGESCCKETNIRIKSYLQGKLPCPDEYVLNGTIRKIALILQSFDIYSVLDNCRWGPGSTLSVNGKDTSSSSKFDVDRDITRDAYYLYKDCLTSAYPHWEGLNDPNFVVGNKIVTVPKNAKTDRTIAVEPGLNSWIQLGIGSLIRKRLGRNGYNLNSDLKNKRGAYLGSVGYSLATVDFKMASDTLSSQMVELLLPPVWFQCLDAARSRYYSLENKVHRSEKFSTMGNGFTFELESLIFVSLALAVCESMGADCEYVSIFGDDLVIPSQCVSKLTEMCSFLGFTINPQKSFSSGAFRESCGSYFFSGMDVKPYFNKTDLCNAKSLYRALNSIRALSHSRNANCGMDKCLYPVWSLVFHYLPASLRLVGPVDGGDAVIHGNIPSLTDRKVSKDGWCGFYYTGLPSIPIDIAKDSHGLFMSRLMSRSRDMELNNHVSLREKTKLIYKSDMFCQQWYDFGVWC